MSVLLFGMWDCHCTTIATDVPARCPVHGKDLMAVPSPAAPMAGMPLGYEPADKQLFNGIQRALTS